MREINNSDSNNNVFNSNNIKCVKVNRVSCTVFQEKNFLMGVQNARNILKNLELSIQKSKKYEKKLLNCKKSHSHTHSSNDSWDSDVSKSQSSADTQSSRLYAFKTKDSSPVRVADAWSTISTACLQYKYDKLSKRYEELLKLYDECCDSLGCREAALAALRERARETDDELQRVHGALLSVGKQYIDIKCKRFVQKVWYEERISHLKGALAAILSAAERARNDFDEEVGIIMNCEHDAAVRLLLAEIKKCNLLFLENLRLKYKM